MVRVLPRARREPVGGGGDHRHERGDRRPPGAAHACACPSLVLYREHEYLREASRYMGERLPGARDGRGARAPTTCRGRATRRPCSTRSSASSAALRDGAGRAGPGADHRARGRPARSPSSGCWTRRWRASAGRRSTRRPAACARASTARPAPSAARPRWPTTSPRCAPASTRASASCATARLGRPGAGDRRRTSPPRAAPGRDPRDLDRAGPRRRLRASSSPSAARLGDLAPVQRRSRTLKQPKGV